MKKYLLIICIFLILPSFAVNVIVESLSDIENFSYDTQITARVVEFAEFKSGFYLKTNDEIQGTIVEAVEAKKGKRNGYLIINPQKIIRNDEEIYFDDNLEAKLVAYSKREWGKTTLKAGLWTGLAVGSYFLPGISQAFYFSKGFLFPYEGKSRMRSGWKSVYENSVFVLFKRGEELSIAEGDYLILKFYYSDVPKYRHFKRTK